MRLTINSANNNSQLPQPAAVETSEIQQAVYEIATERFDNPLNLIFELANLGASTSVMQLHIAEELKKVMEVGKGSIFVE